MTSEVREKEGKTGLNSWLDNEKSETERREKNMCVYDYVGEVEK